MTRKAEFTPEQIADALMKSGGLVSYAAEILGCTRSTVYNYINDNDVCKEAKVDAKEKKHDFVEGKLMELIKGGNVTAVIFYCKTQLKERGYVERQEITGADGNVIDMEVKFRNTKDINE